MIGVLALPASHSRDVIVIGGGRRPGSPRRRALAGRGARVTVARGAAAPGRARDAPSSIPRRARRVDNGQHVLMGCYRETFAFLRRIGASRRVRVQPSLARAVHRQRGRSARCSLPAAAGAVAPPGRRHRVGRARLERPPVGAAAGRAREDRAAAASRSDRPDGVLAGRDRRELARPQRADAAAARDAVGAAGAGGAEPAAREAAAPTFVRVLAEMFGRDPAGRVHRVAERAARRRCMPRRPRDYIEARGGEVWTNALARVIVEGGRAVGVRARGGRTSAPRAVVSHRALVRAAAAVRRGAARRCSASCRTPRAWRRPRSSR